MRRFGKVFLWCLGVVLLLPIVAVAVVLIALNTDPGRRFAESQIASLTGNMVVLKGLEGRFPDRIRLAHVEVRDKKGPWLLGDNLALNWSPLALLHKQVLVNRLDASLLQVPRLAETEPAPTKPAAESNQSFSLPVQVTVEQLGVGRIEIGAPVIGKDAALSLAGRADVQSLETATAALTLKRLPVPAGGPEQPGTYALTAQFTPDRINASLNVQEPEHGLIATLASLPNIGALDVNAAVNGPRSALATHLNLSAGPLTATASGAVDLPGSTLTLDLMAQAPAMQPAPEVSWQAIALNAHVAGPFTAPDATGTLRLDDVKAAGAAIQSLKADLAGNKGRVNLSAVLAGLRIPGPKPGLLADAPLKLDANVQLDQPGRPASYVLTHPLIDLKGTALTAGVQTVDAVLTLPELAPLAEAAGQLIEGHTSLHLHAKRTPELTTLDADGTVAITGGAAPAPALVGRDAKLALAVKMRGQDIAIDRLTLNGAAVAVAASGDYQPKGVDFNAQVGLSDLSLVTPTLKGDAKLAARVRGPLDNFALESTLTGDIGAEKFPPGPIKLTANLTGLPTAPTGRITGEGALDGAPLQLALDASRGADGTLRATINQANWRSFHADGDLTLAQGATLPQGKVAIKFTRLEDLRPVIGQPVGGSVVANLQLGKSEISLDAEASKAGLPSQQVGHATIKAHVADPLKDPSVKAILVAQGIDAAGVTGAARVDIDGPQSALDIKTTADIAASGANAKIAAAALLNVPAKTLRLAALQVIAGNAAIQPQTVRLLAPATIDYGQGVAVDRLRIGLQQAVLDVAGRFSPSLDATITLRTPADIAAIAAPDLALNGNIALDARLTGAPAKPGGTIKLTATGIQTRKGPGQAIPPANLDTTITLQGTSARLNARLAAGSANLAVNGQVPLGAGRLDLRGNGGLDLALTDPILVAQGRRARGKVSLDVTVTGTAAKPEIGGTMRLANGEIQDFSQGLRLNDIAGLFRFEGETLRIASLRAKAGDGTISVQGSVGVLAPTLPVDIAITARNARPLSSDLITAVLNADLKIGGAVTSGIDASGDVLIKSAELRIPSGLPTSVVTLDVHRPGDETAPPPAPSAPVGLDLHIRAPEAVFIRGRGVNAEMAGDLRIRGTSQQPQVSGGLNMRRGQLDIAGTTLTFDTGKIGFDGTGVSGKIDPTLDFVANSTAGGITATLEITGYVSDPKIKLSSSPTLPQDEVLAYLIFKRSAKELGPFQIAGIAAGLAELSGVTGGGGGPLDKVRQGLGLDRLSLGSDSDSSKSISPTVEAGKYVANGVYLGAKQGTTGGQTQAQVQIDIFKGLKLESDVGAGKGGNEVGLSYQFEY